MTSIYDIDIVDIELFLRGNNVFVPENDKLSYQEAKRLMKNPRLLFYPPSISEWIIAHNLLLTKTKVPSYTEEEILALPQNELNKLAELLTMRTNNRYNIIKILYYMNKLKV
jgi:hypothetical protein